MSVFLDDTKKLKLYRTPFYLPVIKENRREGSAIFLMTKDMESSIKLMTHPLSHNVDSFRAYYLERNVMMYITEMMHMVSEDYAAMDESISAKERNSLDKSVFGIPEDRKYPLDSAKHVKSAIHLFGHAEESKKKALAKRIAKAAKHYGIAIKTDTEVYNYLNEGMTNNVYYAADTKILNRLKPVGQNMNSNKPIWCMYMWHSEDLAAAYGLQKAVRVHLAKVDPAKSLHRPVYDIKKHRFCLVDTDYDRVKKLCEGVPFYTYNTVTNLNKNSDGELICSNYPTIMGQTNYLVRRRMFNQVIDKVSLKEYNRIQKEFEASPKKFVLDDADEKYQANNVEQMPDIDLTPKGLFFHARVLDDDIGKQMVTESTILEETEENDYRANDFIQEGASMIDESGFIANVDGDKFHLYFDEAVDAMLENDATNPKLRKILYGERIRNNKQQLLLYEKIKEALPDVIKRTFVDLKMYKQKNIFVDLSYYMKAFFKNNIYKLDQGLDLFVEMVDKSIHNPRLAENGYTKKTVFVNVNDWADSEASALDYKDNPNPMSAIYRYIKRRDDAKLKTKFGGIDWVFMSDKAYFSINFDEFDKVDLPKFISLIRKLITDDISDAELIRHDSKEVLVTKFADRLEDRGIVVRNITGGTKKLTAKEVNDKLNKGELKLNQDDDTDKAIMMNMVNDKAEKSSSEDEMYKHIDDTDKEWLANIIDDLQSDSNVNISATRAARMSNLNDKLYKKILNGKSIKDYISEGKAKPIPKDNIPIDSINEEWQDVHFSNFNKAYDLDADAVSIFSSMISKSEPLSIIDIKKEDTSTVNDYIETWTVKFEDVNGKRHNIVVDMPKFIDNRFMKLRGNLKTIEGQILLLPVTKTDEDTVQIVSNYNKIFIYRINPSNGSKATPAVSILTKVLNKYKGKNVKVSKGDNSFVCSKYSLPIEYRALAGLYSRIEFSNGTYFSFNADEMNKAAKKARTAKGQSFDEKDIYMAYQVNTKEWYHDIENLAMFIINSMRDLASQTSDEELKNLCESTKPSDKCAYTSASIMSSDIPVIVVMAYSEGLTKAMDKGNVDYYLTETRPKYMQDTGVIKFKDGYVCYKNTPASSLLMQGLQKCDTSFYSIKDINKKEMWIDFLENFGGRIKADGLDNFYDLMIDPITKEVCEIYHLPTDYIEILGYASGLLADTKYIKHVDITGNRFRTNEIIAGYLYKAISNAYGEYKNQLKRNKNGAEFSVKRSAVIDNILMDPTASDLSILSPVLEAEATNTFTFKGLSGMNSDRSYTLDKRIYDKSMMGVIGVSTGFAGNVGVTRQSTINATITSSRGTIAKPEKYNTLNTLSINEALTPFSTTHDDPTRVAMGFIQSSKHQMRVKRSTPNLVTTGADEALPYLTSNIFSHKFKGKKGKVLDVTQDYIVYQDSDTKEVDYISIKENVMKNSDGGFFVSVKLSPNVKKGQTLHYNDILAYDKTSYSKAIGTEESDGHISYNSGTMIKLGVIPTDEAYEDSSIITESLADSLTTEYLVKKDRYIAKDSNLYQIVSPGTPIQEGDSLLVFQNAFEEKDANALLRALTDSDIEAVSDLGKIHLHSKLTGVVQDVRIYRTCELDELSPSLRKVVNAYEKKIKKDRAYLEKLGVKDTNKYLGADYKLEPTGNLKGAPDGVMIEFYLKCTDKMGIGDKLIYNYALKGVVKKVISEGDEPYTDLRPNEKIEALLTTSGINARMVTSIIVNGLINKILIETTRQCQEKLGLKWRNLYEIESNEDR